MGLKIQKKFWKNKKVLITGHTGFIGSWLFFYFDNILTAQTFGISLKPKKKSLYNKLRIKNSRNSYIADIKNFKKIDQLIKKIKPEIIIHLAAQPLVLESVKKPIETFNTNVNGTLNLLRIIRKYKFIKNVIFFTSDKVYRTGYEKYFNENSPLGGNDPYSASKAASEIVINSYSKIYLIKKNITVLRAGNIIGGGDYNKNRLFYDISNSILKNKTLVVRNKNHSRPWQHIIDVIQTIRILLEKLHKKKGVFQQFNIGPSIRNNLSIKKIIEKYLSNFDLKIKYLNNPTIETENLNIDTSKIYKTHNIKNNLNLKNSIKFTLDWYIKFGKNKAKAEEICKNQIIEYENKKSK